MNSNIFKFGIIGIICFLILITLNRSHKHGIALIVFFQIILPRELFVQLGAGLPTLTGYRAIMLILAGYSFFGNPKPIEWKNPPFISILLIVLVVKGISLIGAYDFNQAFNVFLIFGIERVLYYYLLVYNIDSYDTIKSIIVACTTAVLIIATIGLIERYTFFNPVDYITYSGSPRFDPRNYGVVYSTFSHPIHFGLILAMGWPLCLLFTKKQNKTSKFIIEILILFIYAGLYFSQSRGPWLAFCIASISLVVFKFPNIKKRLLYIALFAAILLILRPGVYNSIMGLTHATFETNSLEGGSFQYRFELFRKAYSEISKSSYRLAFGYGDGASHSMDLSGQTTFDNSGRIWRFWSWDNEYAEILLHGGFVGLIVNIILYFSVLVYLINRYRKLQIEKREIFAVFIGSCSVLVFMMTNVSIFSPQLHYLFWTNIALAISFDEKWIGLRNYKKIQLLRRFQPRIEGILNQSLCSKVR